MTTGHATSPKSRQQFTEQLAADAAALALSYFHKLKDLKVETKNPGDFVSEADRNVELMIRDRLAAAYPGEDIVGEEGGGTESDAFWSLDPIDGTSNFLAGIPFWGVSIGYCENGTPTVGAICIPLLDILVSASHGAPGIRFNGSAVTDFIESAIPSFILGRSPDWDRTSFRQVEDLFISAELDCLDVRCSVVGIAFAALGMTHGYYEEQTNMWDVAAGFILARQAGLQTSIRRTETSEKLTISALSPSIYNKIGQQLGQRDPERGAMK